MNNVEKNNDKIMIENRKNWNKSDLSTLSNLLKEKDRLSNVLKNKSYEINDEMMGPREELYNKDILSRAKMKIISNN